MFKRIIANEGIQESKIQIMPNAVDPEIFGRNQIDGARIREQYGLVNKIVVGYVGGFAYWHRLDLLISIVHMNLTSLFLALFICIGSALYFLIMITKRPLAKINSWANQKS